MIDRVSPLTPRDDKKKAVSDVLKRVDMLMKQNDLKAALQEAHRAKEIDPKNVYAAAYEERIANLIKDVWVDEPKTTEAPASPSVEQTQPQKRILPKPTLPPDPVLPDRPAEQVSEPPSSKTAPPEQRPTGAPAKKDEPFLVSLKKQLEAYEKYKKSLMEIWKDGVASGEEREWLNALRNTLHISDQDHQRLEQDVQIEAYLETLKGAWKHGVINPESAGLLAEMRKTFKISQEDHDRIEARFLAELQAHEKKQAKIVVIDDDEKLLEIICQTLQESGFSTLPFTTSDDAYGYLKAGSVPDLILCDVNLETSTMGGFSFYERLQWMEHITEVPFIFLTGLTDEVLVRTGKELGVDDYLTKPISDQTLISTVKGKLKRFQRIKERRS